MEGVVVSKAAVLPFWTPEELLIRVKGVISPVIGPGPICQCIDGWGASVPIKQNLKNQERDDEHMGTRKNNSLNFDSWLLRSWNSTGRCSGLFPPNCLHKQQLTSVKHSGPHVLSTTVPRTAEMGAQWDLSSLCVQVGFPPFKFPVS